VGRVVAIGYSRAVSDFDYDQLVIGSGFGGSVAALRLAERMMGVVPDRYFRGEGLEALRNAARDAGCFTEQEIRHVSLHDLRHGALTKLGRFEPCCRRANGPKSQRERGWRNWQTRWI
jgi:hypothetical protein